MRPEYAVNGQRSQGRRYTTYTGGAYLASFKQRLTKAIEQSGKPKGKIAEEMGVRQERVSKWLRTGAVEQGYLMKLPKVLGIDGHWLLTGEGEMRRLPPTMGEAAMSQIFAIVDRVREMGPAAAMPPEMFKPQPRPTETKREAGGG